MLCRRASNNTYHSFCMALVILTAICLLEGCIGDVNTTPTNGSVESGPLMLGALWNSALNNTTFKASLDNYDVTDKFTVTGNYATASVGSLPGKKLYSVSVADSIGIPHEATSIFTATSEYPRETISGGLLSFQCEDSFLNSPIQVPGVDLDLGFTESVCKLLTIRGVFPSGKASFPQQGSTPLLYGAFPEQVTFDIDALIPNGISVSPVDVGLTFPFEPGDPTSEGKVCYFGFEMRGVIMPVQPAIPGYVHAAMIQELNKAQVSVVKEGQCQELYTSPDNADLVTFNYLAKK